MEFVVKSPRAADTRRWGIWLADRLQGGDVVCLHGELGAGKTAFAQGVGAGLGVVEPLVSPTFALIHEYAIPARGIGASRLIHMDLCRLRCVEEAEQIGVPDYCQEDNICVIEWPDVAADLLPSDCLELTIEGSGAGERTLFFRAAGGGWADRLAMPELE